MYSKEKKTTFVTTFGNKNLRLFPWKFKEAEKLRKCLTKPVSKSSCLSLSVSLEVWILHTKESLYIRKGKRKQEKKKHKDFFSSQLTS